MRQLAPISVLPDLTGEQTPDAGHEVLLRPPRLVEEGEIEKAAPIGDDDLENGPASSPHVSGRCAGDLGDHRDVVAHLERGEIGELATIGVAPRIVTQQVVDRLQTELPQHLG